MDGLYRAKVVRAPGPDGVYGIMVRVGAPCLKSILPALWKTCGSMKQMPTLWRTQATKPAYKVGPTDDPKSYRPIGTVPTLCSVIDHAFRRSMERTYTPHVAQHGFPTGVSPEHAILRIIYTTRVKNALFALLDLESTYPSVPRQKLIDLVRERVGGHLADMLTVLLAPTCMTVIGDPMENRCYPERSNARRPQVNNTL
jgi:hypothetical protein